jgi:hypothetical protein
MKLYSSFLIRCWLIRDLSPEEKSADEKFVFDIEHIQKGEHLRLAGPKEAMEWIMAALRAEDSNSSQIDCNNRESE